MIIDKIIILEQLRAGVKKARERVKDSGAVIGDPILISVERIKHNEI